MTCPIRPFDVTKLKTILEFHGDRWSNEDIKTLADLLDLDVEARWAELVASQSGECPVRITGPDLATAWCKPETSHKEMDVVLAMAIAEVAQTLAAQQFAEWKAGLTRVVSSKNSDFESGEWWEDRGRLVVRDHEGNEPPT